jgi:hypothetical protein
MRRRDLIKKLKDDAERLRAVNGSASFSSDPAVIQAKYDKRQAILHGLETLLPEIIEKLES